MKRLLIPIMILCILISGCLGNDAETETFEGELTDLIVPLDDLPWGYVIKTHYGGETKVIGTLDELAVDDDGVLHISYEDSINDGQSVRSTSVSLGIGRYGLDSVEEKLVEGVKLIEDNFMEVMEATEAGTIDGWENGGVETVEHEAIGDRSYVLKVTKCYDHIGPNPEDYAECDTSYYIVFMKKDVLVGFTLDNRDPRLDLDDFISLARDVADRI